MRAVRTGGWWVKLGPVQDSAENSRKKKVGVWKAREPTTVTEGNDRESCTWAVAGPLFCAPCLSGTSENVHDEKWGQVREAAKTHEAPDPRDQQEAKLRNCHRVHPGRRQNWRMWVQKREKN